MPHTFSLGVWFRHAQIINMIVERHILACSTIRRAISKTDSQGSLLLCLHGYRQGWPEPYIRCTYGIFDLEITKYTAVYIYVYIRFWPTLDIGRPANGWLCKIFRSLIHLKLELYQSGSFHPGSQTKIG